MINKEHLKQQHIGDIVAKDFRTAEIFKKYGIDFCCGGGKSIEKACTDQHVDCEKLIDDLLAIDKKPTEKNTDFNKWSLTQLADYIEEKHHSYVLSNLQIIQEFSDKVAKVHGKHNPETIEINRLYTETAQELAAHLRKEELILFPYIKKLEKSLFEDLPLDTPHFGTVKSPINMMFAEHESAGDNFKKIATLSNNYTPPEYACNTYRVLYAKLKEFEEDLHKHVHLENNILFPKAIKLEENLSRLQK